MKPEKETKKLLVRKIENGIVIDHIPAGKASFVLKILNLDPYAKTVVATNVNSKKIGKKDIIKVEGKYLTSKELDLISLVAPSATISQIDGWEVKKKHNAKMPKVVEGIFTCRNLSCPTNSMYPENTKFKIIKTKDANEMRIRCMHCKSYLYYGTILEDLTSGKIVIRGLVSRDTLERQFLDLLVKKGAFKVAKTVKDVFMLKSGRPSTYFVNLRSMTDGESLARMKWFFSSFIAHLLEQGLIEDFDYIFGPAYAGINLATITCEGLNEFYGIKKRFLYDRKEAKNYGDVRADKLIVGAGHFKPGQKILIVDDVMTTGKTKIESLEKLKILGDHTVVGIVLAVDRQEKIGTAEKPESRSATEYMEKEIGVKVFPILEIKTVFNILKDTLPPKIKKHWINYYDKYGVVKLK